jgi:lipopolysaccharide/colanic/teichoic acid biosynthesis glycosyltransferase
MCEAEKNPAVCVRRGSATLSPPREAARRTHMRAPALGHTWGNSAIRRCLDILGSAVLLLISAPAWPGIALIIRLESPGPLFISQLRGGRYERPFRLRKFRSMRESSIPRGSSPTASRKERNMHRTTKFGRVLRRTSLDELPQLLNVLWGHMSLIGPRPLVFQDINNPRDIAPATGKIEPEAFAQWRRVRCQVRPGLTGLWQIRGRSSLPLEGMLRYDVEYVQRCSLGLDLEILLRTVPAVLRGIGAF